MTRDKRTAILQVATARGATGEHGSQSRGTRVVQPERDLRGVNWRALHGEAIAAGFEGIEVPLGSLAKSAAPGNDRTSHDTLTELEAAGIQAKVVAAACACCDLETVLAELKPLLRRFADVGATCLNLTLPPVAGRPDPDAQAFASYQEALNFAYQILHHARFDAEATGVALALEVAVGGSLLSPVELREIIDDANSWAVGVCVDAPHIRRVGLTADWIATLGRRVHSIRWEPNPPRPRVESASREDQEAEEIAQTLETLGYDRPVIAAGADGPSALRRTLDALCGRSPTSHPVEAGSGGPRGGRGVPKDADADG